MSHPLPTPLPVSFAGRDEARFLLLPDLHVPHSPDIQELILASKLMDSIDHVILLGDTVACYGTDYEYAALSEFLSRLGKPYTAVIGNHEFSFEVHDCAGGQYGKVWKTGSPEMRHRQISKFKSFFDIDKSFWCERAVGASFAFCMLDDWDDGVISRHNVQHEHDAIKELPAGCDAFLRASAISAQQKGEPLLVFCHVPLFGSLPDDFVYYEPGRDPTIYLETDTLEILRTSGIPVWWFSGHLHLSPHHPDAGVRVIQSSLTQVHCPSPRWFVRRARDDHHARRYEESYSQVLKVTQGKPVLELWNWLADEPLGLGGCMCQASNIRSN